MDLKVWRTTHALSSGQAKSTFKSLKNRHVKMKKNYLNIFQLAYHFIGETVPAKKSLVGSLID